MKIKPILRTIMIVSIVTFFFMTHDKEAYKNMLKNKTEMTKKWQKCKSYTWQSESNSRIFQP